MKYVQQKSGMKYPNLIFKKKISHIFIGLFFMIMTILLSPGHIEAGKIVGIILIVVVTPGISIRSILNRK